MRHCERCFDKCNIVRMKIKPSFLPFISSDESANNRLVLSMRDAYQLIDRRSNSLVCWKFEGKSSKKQGRRVTEERTLLYDWLDDSDRTFMLSPSNLPYRSTIYLSDKLNQLTCSAITDVIANLNTDSIASVSKLCQLVIRELRSFDFGLEFCLAESCALPLLDPICFFFYRR